MPPGARLSLDRTVRSFRRGTVLAGGYPGRVVRLTARGAASVTAMGHRSPQGTAEHRLAQRLIEAGIAHPVLPHHEHAGVAPAAADVTVVVPARDRAEALDACLASLGATVPVVVVDDGSDDPAAVARVCGRRGATLVRRTASGGPAAARNDGLAAVRTGLVAFVDSDCTVPPGWLDGLCWHFGDPSVGGVAPRVRPRPPSGGSAPVAQRYLAARSPLDMGRDAGEVGPGRRVRYVPTAALVVRREALPAGRFDAALRFGEDVDLVWRLLDAGWRLRYEPSVTVDHREPTSWRGLLARRFRYGTSAGPLAARHPGHLAPVELRPATAAAAVAALAGQLPAAGAVTGMVGATLARQVAPLGIPTSQALRWSGQAVGWSVVGLGRAATMLGAPALVAALVAGRRSRRAALGLLLVPPAVDWWQRRPHLDPVRWGLASVADDIAYGCGVWAGAVRARTARPLLPVVHHGRGGPPA